MKKAMYVRLLAPGKHTTDIALVLTVSARTPHSIRAEMALERTSSLSSLFSR